MFCLTLSHLKVFIQHTEICDLENNQLNILYVASIYNNYFSKTYSFTAGLHNYIHFVAMESNI